MDNVDKKMGSFLVHIVHLIDVVYVIHLFFRI